MIYTTTESIPGREITEILAVVSGNVVQSKHLGRDIMAQLKSLVGGEIVGYTEMLAEARTTATTTLDRQCRRKRRGRGGRHSLYHQRHYERLIRDHGVWYRGCVKPRLKPSLANPTGG